MLSLRTPYVSNEVWDALDHLGKVNCLRLLADRAWVHDQVDRLNAIAVRAVELRWLRRERNVTLEDLVLFQQERTAAKHDGTVGFWDGALAWENRCRHAASRDGCRVIGCSYQWRPLPPPSDRYFKGLLRLRILERDGYRCQYCGERVRDGLPRDHPEKANIDHVIPYPIGPTTFENGKTACTLCNALKGADQWVDSPISLDDP
jgi:5-methylcytosine-specific restriction endonuclease McrA